MDLVTQALQNKAADLIKQRGWRQGSSRSDDRLCLVKAIAQAVWPHDNDYFPVAEAIVERLGLSNRYDLVDWNDHEDRTEAEVLAVLRGELLKPETLL